MNTSGIHPTRMKVLIKPKVIEEKTSGGVFLPEQNQEREQYAATEGTIIECAPLAYSEFNDDEWGGSKPKAGDYVFFAKYAGLHVKGNDGEKYIIANDEDIIAIKEAG